VFDYRLGVTPEIFSTFRHHPKAYSKEEYAVEDICWKLFLLASETLRQRLAMDTMLRSDDERIGCKEFTSLVGELREWQHRLEKLRRRKNLWIFNPTAWQARSTRNRFRRLVNERKQAIIDHVKYSPSPSSFLRQVSGKGDVEKGTNVKYTRAEIFLVTFQRDFEYLKWFLKSVEKFCSGFASLAILVPEQDYDELKKLVLEYKGDILIRCLKGKEWARKGMLWHMAQVCRADEWCPDADFVLHIDPDCIFLDHVTPETFIKDGKPILQYERYDSIGKQHGKLMAWKTATEKCLPFEIEFETMRQHPEIYRRDLYKKTRKLVEEKTGQPFDEYVKFCKNEFPQTFAEFPTLGSVAMHCFPNDYHLIDCATNPDAYKFPVVQFLSHRKPHLPLEIWWKGEFKTIIPLEKIKEILG
jgi:hypothetical protein